MARCHWAVHETLGIILVLIVTVVLTAGELCLQSGNATANVRSFGESHGDGHTLRALFSELVARACPFRLAISVR